MKIIHSITLCGVLGSLLVSARPAAAAEYDLVIYGGTCAAVTAAVQAKRMGKSVIIVSPDQHLGGLSSSGLGFTDTGDKSVIGGLSREFYRRVWSHYDQPEAWQWQKREAYGGQGQGTPAMDGAQRTMWIFEPHVAEQVFEAFVKENDLMVVRDAWLDRMQGVKKTGSRITSITTLGGQTYEGKMFIDATYEGDLMAAAGVDFHVGREAASQYNEKWNGVQVGVLHHQHHFGAVQEKISPYVVPGDPASGFLPGVSKEPPGEYGAADRKVQAYCFRMCLTDHPENRIPFPKPEGYDASQYELLVRIFQAGWRGTFDKFDPIPNRKTDTNNHGPFSTDNIGMNWDYPEAGYQRRREIVRQHELYQKGWLYFIANDPRVPDEVQQEMRRWGLPRDEFADNGHWPRQLYIREARRMVGSYVMTENDLLKKRVTPDSVGMGSYGIDSHNVQRYITPEGHVQNEGDIGVRLQAPYEIAYGSLVPKRGQADNLLVPVCPSSSHIAFGSIRMEPVFMILGQSAATAAVMAIDAGSAVQDVPYEQLKERLVKDGQILHAPARAALPDPAAPSAPSAPSAPAAPAAAPAPASSNYDESKILPYTLPDLFTLADGGKVTTSAIWENRRRSELLDIFRREVYGIAPPKPDTLTFRVVESDPAAMDGKATRKQVALSFPLGSGTFTFHVTLFVPNQRTAPAPVFLLLNHRPVENTDPTRTIRKEFWPAEDAISRGYAIAAINVSEEVEPDKRDATTGIRAFYRQHSAKSDELTWGALAAWAWSGSRALDYFETDPDVNAAQVAVIGHSRTGKTALWAAAQDTRIALASVNGAGEGGPALSRRNFGETIRQITTSFPYWFTPKYATYADKESTLPIDQHQLIALVAPRGYHGGHGTRDTWADPRGAWLSLVEASKVWAMFGKTAAWRDDMPPVNELRRDGPLAYHIHEGGHDLTAFDWKLYLDHADQLWPRTPAK